MWKIGLHRLLIKWILFKESHLIIKKHVIVYMSRKHLPRWKSNSLKIDIWMMKRIRGETKQTGKNIITLPTRHEVRREV